MNILLSLFEGVGVTLSITLLAAGIGIVFGALLAAVRMSPNVLLKSAAKIFINVVRGIPPIVWLFVIFYGVGSTYMRFDPFTTAVLTLGTIAVVQLAEVYRGGLLSVPSGQSEAARVLGFGRFRTFVLVQLPQALLAALPAGATVIIGLIKDSAVASIIGVQDITARAASGALRSESDIPIYLGAALFYIAISIPVALLARRVHTILARRVHVQ